MNRKQDRTKTSVGTALSIALAILLLGQILLSSASPFGIQNGYADNNWYVGKGVKPGMYFTYKIQEHDTKQGQPFIMTIYFKQFDSSNNYWIAPVYVIEPDGKVLNGTFHLSDLDLSALGSSQIPPEMRPYRTAYVSSLDWLASFVPKPGLSLTSPSWGKLAAIGGSPIAPSGSAKVTVPAGTFDTTVVAWHYGADNSIYIDPNLPYPVSAKAFAAVTTGSPPIQFSFQLISMGQGPPPIPKSLIQVAKPPITLQTGRGTYYITIVNWEPAPIMHARDTKFGILFMDSSKSIVNQVSYSFQVTTPDGKTIKDVTDQKAPDGTGIQIVNIPKAGPFTAKISVDVVSGMPRGEFIESATFNLVAS